MSDCVFCKIVRKEVAASIVHEDEHVLVFKDIFPQAPVHLLIIPKAHAPGLGDMTPEVEAAVARIPALAGRLAAEHGVASEGWRLIANTGAHAGQTVFHVHFHLLGGKPLGGKLCQ